MYRGPLARAAMCDVIAPLVKSRAPPRYWESAITLAKGAVKMKLNLPRPVRAARQDPT